MQQQPPGISLLPPPPAPVFLIGIGGIGMSGLAQLLRWQGHVVGGSDRDLTSPGREELVRQLRAAGIRVWEQDGSGVRRMAPAVLVASSAVESGNPDLAAAVGLSCLPRARALAEALERVAARQIAIAGSCGKTTVTAWTASALRRLGASVLTVCGGQMIEHQTPEVPGNFASDPEPEWVVFEADESDGSLVEFHPAYGAVLNLGPDHFEQERLIELFSRFLANCSAGLALPRSLETKLRLPANLRPTWFAGPSDPEAPETLRARNCTTDAAAIRFDVPGLGAFTAGQFGQHSAANAAAVLALLRCAVPESTPAQLRQAVAGFGGVRRRFERLGRTPRGVPVFDDYAHNPAKIKAALLTAQELSSAPVLAIFQPHGYGPLKFMRAQLEAELRQVLRKNDTFVFLPVYYAGGTTSFEPEAVEVAREYAEAGLPVTFAPDRETAARLAREQAPDCGLVVVLGARDPSLALWARQLTRET